MQNSVMQDVDEFYSNLDAMFAQHASANSIESYLLNALNKSQAANNNELQLSVLNEIMGFYRSRGEHAKNNPIINSALDLLKIMRIFDTDAGTTTLINAATSLRAAGNYERAGKIYTQALLDAEKTLGTKNRKLAALHNNLSMLYSETGRAGDAISELKRALEILQNTSTDPERDVDIAATHTNLALAILQDFAQKAKSQKAENSEDFGDSEKSAILDSAFEHASTSIRMYKAGNNENQPHYTSALAGFAQVECARGKYADAVESYSKALDLIAECYGKDSESYAITLENLQETRKLAEKFAEKFAESSAIESAENHMQNSAEKSIEKSSQNIAKTTTTTTTTITPKIQNGIELAKEYWKTYGKSLLENPEFATYKNRIAAGLVGHGSECYGFDDEISRDHDFGPGFCLWLTDDDYAKIGADLQEAYNALPRDFAGFTAREETPRAKAAAKNRRVGVFAISEFFENITGFSTAPSENEPHLWIALDEPTLAAATNGCIFADPLGEFSKTRQSFKLMPDDVRFSLISRRLGMISQAGQYNFARMIARDDSAASWLAINEFVRETASIVFLLNNPVTAGYLPYYKWQFAALRKLSKRMASRLSEVCEKLELLMQLSSAACFGGSDFGEGGKGARFAQKQATAIIDEICGEIVAELKYQGLTNCGETFLEWQRPYVEAHIRSSASCLRSL